jgi:regulator of PEP synthase PpsR (kinase-PPPase family)
MKQQVYLISDSTGITAAALADSLLNQFQGISFEITTFRYVDSPSRLAKVCEQIEAASKQRQQKPIVFSTLVEGAMRVQLNAVDGHVFDLMGAFLTPLEEVLGRQASPMLGYTHGQREQAQYHERMDAVNYALRNDDGVSTRHYDQADIILIGVSRCGKTPTCLYLAMQYSMYAANYPLVVEDLEATAIPAALNQYKDRLFALSIEPQRLQHIRQQRRPDSNYASLKQCQHEVRLAEILFRELGVPVCDVTSLSVEEIATRVLRHVDELQ